MRLRAKAHGKQPCRLNARHRARYMILQKSRALCPPPESIFVQSSERCVASNLLFLPDFSGAG